MVMYSPNGPGVVVDEASHIAVAHDQVGCLGPGWRLAGAQLPVTGCSSSQVVADNLGSCATVRASHYGDVLVLWNPVTTVPVNVQLLE